MELKQLKLKYELLMKKYKLPSFKELNEDFDIQKIQEHDSETLLRDIRKIILEKMINYLRFIEVLLNPGNGPMFFMLLIKNLNEDYKKNIEKLYFELGKIEVNAICHDISYDEEKEAEFIKEIIFSWKKIKPELKKLGQGLKKAWDKETVKKDRSYFG